MSMAGGVTARLLVPLSLTAERDFVGFGSAMMFGETREWPEQDIEDLQLAFNVIAIAESRMRNQVALQTRERFRSMLANISTSLLEAELKEIGNHSIAVCHVFVF